MSNINWTLTKYTNNEMYGLTVYAPELGLYVAESLTYPDPARNSVTVSTDAINWTTTSIGTFGGSLSGITYSQHHKIFVEGIYGGNKIIYSKNGIDWTESNFVSGPSNGYAGYFTRCVYSEEKDLFVMVGSNYEPNSTNNNTKARIVTSKDGINWDKTIQLDQLNNLYNVTYSAEKGLFVACTGVVGYQNSQNTNNGIIVSKDGYNWAPVFTSDTINLTSVIYGNGKFIAFGVTNLLPNLTENFNTVYATSTDGYTWTPFVSLMNIVNCVVTYPAYSLEHNLFVIVRLDLSGVLMNTHPIQDTICYTSTDGINWSISKNFGNAVYGEYVSYANGKFILPLYARHAAIIGYIYTGVVNPTTTTVAPTTIAPTTVAPTTIAPICLVAGTPIFTDQGTFPIESLDPKKHTIAKKRIIAITKAITPEKELIVFEKGCLGINCPSKRTIMTPGHEVLYKGKLIQAKKFINNVNGVHTIPYTGEVVYNVLQETHGLMLVNNMTLETLHPNNKVAKNILK